MDLVKQMQNVSKQIQGKIEVWVKVQEDGRRERTKEMLKKMNN